MTINSKLQQKTDETLPECPLHNVTNSLVAKNGQKEERRQKGFDFFSTQSRRKQYMSFPSLWLQSQCESRAIGFHGSLIQATAVSWRSMYHLIGRGFARFYLLMATVIFIDISISITAGSNSLGVELGGFPPFKLHYGCSFLYRINHLTH